jgi:hypothetical protein
MDREIRWSIWLPVIFTAIGGVVFVLMLIGSKADASVVARVDRIEVHLKYLVAAVYQLAVHQGVPMAPPPSLE